MFWSKASPVTRALNFQFRFDFVQFRGRFEQKLGGLSLARVRFRRSGFNNVPIVSPSMPVLLPNTTESDLF